MMQAHPVLMDYMPFTPQTRQRLETLARLEPRLLAAMHGSAYEGDGAAALRAAGDVMEQLLGWRLRRAGRAIVKHQTAHARGHSLAGLTAWIRRT